MKYTDNLANSKELSLTDGIAFSRTGGSRSARSYEPLSADPKAREVQIEDRILDNVVDFLDNHMLQLRMPKSLTEDENSIDEEGKRYIQDNKLFYKDSSSWISGKNFGPILLRLWQKFYKVQSGPRQIDTLRYRI